MDTLENIETRIASEHEDVLALLPWFVNHTLVGTEQERVRRHVGECLACRRELGTIRELAGTMTARKTAGPHMSAAESFARLSARLPAKGNVVSLPSRVAASKSRRPAPVPARWTALAVAAMLLLVVGTPAMKQIQTEFAPSFHTLSNRGVTAPDESADLRVVFKTGVSQQKIESLLTEINAEITSGPNHAGAYTVRLNPLAEQKSERSAVVAQLRTRDEILLVEPVGSEH